MKRKIKFRAMNKMKLKLEKILDFESGKIIVRATPEYFDGVEKAEDIIVAEIITRGCVIAFYKTRSLDGAYWVAELREVHDRLTSLKVFPDELIESFNWGRKIADHIIDFYF